MRCDFFCAAGAEWCLLQAADASVAALQGKAPSPKGHAKACGLMGRWCNVAGPKSPPKHTTPPNAPSPTRPPILVYLGLPRNFLFWGLHPQKGGRCEGRQSASLVLRMHTFGVKAFKMVQASICPCGLPGSWSKDTLR